MGHRVTRSYKKRDGGGMMSKAAIVLSALVAVGILIAGGKYLLTGPLFKGNDDPVQESVKPTSPVAHQEPVVEDFEQDPDLADVKGSQPGVQEAPAQPKPAKTEVTKKAKKAVPVASPVDDGDEGRASGASSAKRTATQEPKASTGSPKLTEGSGASGGKQAQGAVPQGNRAVSMIQVGAFSTRAAADSLGDKLKKDGLPVVVQEAEVSGKTFFRVRVQVGGAQGDVDALSSRLQKMGLPIQLIYARGGGN
ncbi:SPOR domain-containing protein [Thermanaerovibrio acidaminovorans]|uniref:SPOR domain-containing protein n=1 Tax=Thermanaerovibrio acidaminovorans TaxID=81462 RepID=UPI0003259D14|nr:SPOR domain-containing protein [Thermanaerovibrio acidaminovorans]